MEHSELFNIQKWFDAYVVGVYGKDAKVNANLKLKEDHSRRVQDEMLYIATALKLSQPDIYLAQAVGLLHDVGRFEQFNAYRTYNDARSTSHSRIGLKVLRENFVLRDIQQNDMSVIESSVEYHSVKDLPDGMSGKRLQFSKMIRDADKIDIYKVVIDGYRKYKEDPDKFELEIEFPLTGGCSPEVLENVRQGRRVDYRSLKTMDDFRLLQLGWVYDVNYAVSLKRIHERGFLNELASMLPMNPEVRETVESVLKYAAERISSSQDL
jgi:CRISPR/Cas system-associated protein Cas10 (large subunit of type III CRISPR-Cas system)